MAYHGDDLYFVLDDLKEWLIDQINHNDRNDLQEIMDKLNEFMADRGVDFSHVT